MSIQTPPLFRLRVPAGWAVIYNRFHNVLPVADPARPGTLKNWGYFTEDLLQIVRTTLKDGHHQIVQPTLLIDVGWYPDSSTDGRYRAVMVWNHLWRDIRSFESTDAQVVRQIIEAWMEDPPPRAPPPPES